MKSNRIRTEFNFDSGESEDLWMALQSMGYNHGMIKDEAVEFKLEMITTQDPNLKVFGLRSGGSLLEKAVIASIIDNADKNYIGTNQEIILFLKVIKC